MTLSIFTQKEVSTFSEGEIVGYDNGNGENFPVKIRWDDLDTNEFSFYCDEYDCVYALDELTTDWFVKL